MNNGRSQHTRGKAGWVSLVVLAMALLIPQSGFGIAKILDAHDPLPNFDQRITVLEPTPEQIAAADALGATVRWNNFGTPHSMIGNGGWLATGYSSNDEAAARQFLQDNAVLFGLSSQEINDLELVNPAEFAMSNARAVLFRQSFGGLPAGAGSGLITVGTSNGKIAYVSSSAATDQGTPALPVISATDGWLNAATNLGISFSLLDLNNVRQENGWTIFEVDGLSHSQRSRLVALPTPGQGVLPAFETIFLNVQGGHAEAYSSFVDAVTGAVVVRENRVQRLADLENQVGLAQETQVFQGAYQDAPDPQACGPMHPYAIPAGQVRVAVTVAAAVTTNDTFINLYFNGALVASGDSGTSPETLLYEPAGGVPPGAYSVEICPFDAPSAPPVPPFSYAGTITWEDTAQPSVFQVPRWDYFTANPPLDLSATDTRELGCWTTTDFNGVPISGCDHELINVASRAPWDHVVQANSSSFTTTGNNARSAEAWGSPLTPAEGYQPIAPDRNYSFQWQNTWNLFNCSQTVFTAPGVTQANDMDAATTNLFAEHNRFHDWSYFLGFTERNYNLQMNNFGNTPPTVENDPEIGNVQAGAVSGGAPSYLGRDNANQITLNDGIPGITNMYLWQPIAAAFYAPCVDGDYDVAVIGHEYHHAVSNRMIGGPDANISGDQGGAMGESWADQMAAEYLNEFGYVPNAGEHPFSVGAYVTGNGETAIRNYNMARNLFPPTVLPPTAALTQRNPLNYSNIGYDMSGVQVHADGEIWSAANYEIRSLLVSKYNGAYPASDAALQLRCATGQEIPEHCPGNRRWAQIVYDSFLLMPAAVSMLDARDAMLAADLMRFGGANQTELWRAFAWRGMGQDASTNGPNDADPIPGFASPQEGEATFRFNVVDRQTGTPIEAKVYIGHYEARSTPIADTIAATALDDSAPFVPRVTHDILVVADGYGHLRFPRYVWPGFVNKTVTLTVRMAKNLASSFNGATAETTVTGVNADKLIDDTENTNWADLTAPVQGDRVTVNLAGDTHTIRRVNVSALLRPEDAADADADPQNRFTALREFEIYTCIEGATLANLTCSSLLDAGFTKIYSSAADAFPAVAPRPTAPELILREFDVPDTQATHVQLRVVNTQCTGAPQFQGEQDADPLNDTDCDTASANGGRVRAAELQVFGVASQPPSKDPAVVFTKTGPATATSGSNVTYGLDYTNLGPFASSNAVITDSLPIGLDFVSATGGGSYDAGSRTVTWNLGTVPVNAPASVSVTVNVSASAGVVVNEAAYSADLTVATPALAVTAVLP